MTHDSTPMIADVSRWVRRTPQPVALQCDEKRVEIPRTGRNWTEIARTVLSLGPRQLNALDGNGNVLRSRTFDENDGDGEDVKPKSGLSTDIQHFASLIADAYDKGGKSYEPLLNNAMQFIERQGVRLSQYERQLEVLRLENAKLRAEIIAMTAEPEQSGGEGTELVHALLAGKAQGEADAAARANGSPPKQEGQQ